MSLTQIANFIDAESINSGSSTLIISLDPHSRCDRIKSLLGNTYGIFHMDKSQLNVRNAHHTRIRIDSQINSIKKIMGLIHDYTYVDTSKLRYDRILLASSNTPDGAYLKGIFINFIDWFWPSLLKIPGFISSIRMPIIQVRPKLIRYPSLLYFVL